MFNITVITITRKPDGTYHIFEEIFKNVSYKRSLEIVDKYVNTIDEDMEISLRDKHMCAFAQFPSEDKTVFFYSSVK